MIFMPQDPLHSKLLRIMHPPNLFHALAPQAILLLTISIRLRLSYGAPKLMLQVGRMSVLILELHIFLLEKLRKLFFL